jgi:formamidopyrimidine-DNA glycosylase
VPELPEVETVRDGLDRHAVGRTITEVQVLRASAVRRHVPGVQDFVAQLSGRTLHAAVRRGKYLWMLLDEAPATEALTVHLGMSGQLLVHHAATAPERRHLRARLVLAAPGEPDQVLDFVDQRTFGYLGLAELVPTDDGGPGGCGSDRTALPTSVAHIARDLLDERLDRVGVSRALRRRHTQVKRALLDQTLVSGVGNIYADEGLWAARLHGERPTQRLTGAQAATLLAETEQVMRAALRAGGTSFDATYVDVHGSSGWFERELAVYGRTDRECPRCGTPVVREAFMNRSSYSCPTCQPAPRRPVTSPRRGPHRPR